MRLGAAMLIFVARFVGLGCGLSQLTNLGILSAFFLPELSIVPQTGILAERQRLGTFAHDY